MSRNIGIVARKLPLHYPGAIYQVINRGDHSEVIFREERDRELLLATLAEACAKTDRQVHALCSMSNPFQLVLETPRANLAQGMKWLLGTYWLVPGIEDKSNCRKKAQTAQKGFIFAAFAHFCGKKPLSL